MSKLFVAIFLVANATVNLVGGAEVAAADEEWSPGEQLTMPREKSAASTERISSEATKSSLQTKNMPHATSANNNSILIRDNANPFPHSSAVWRVPPAQQQVSRVPSEQFTVAPSEPGLHRSPIGDSPKLPQGAREHALIDRPNYPPSRRPHCDLGGEWTSPQ